MRLAVNRICNLFLCTIALALVVAGCGKNDAAAPSPSTQTRSLEGAIVKGPLAGATVAFFHIDQSGHPPGAPVATATSDVHGHVSAGLPAIDEPLLAMSFGGSWVDESDDAGGDNRRCIT